MHYFESGIQNFTFSLMEKDHNSTDYFVATNLHCSANQGSNTFRLWIFILLLFISYSPPAWSKWKTVLEQWDEMEIKENERTRQEVNSQSAFFKYFTTSRNRKSGPVYSTQLWTYFWIHLKSNGGLFKFRQL